MNNNKNKLTIEIDDDFETILICSVRYSIGRQTYMPSLWIGYITPLLPKLSKRALTVIKNDLRETTNLGDKIIDTTMWIYFLQMVESELKERSSNDY